MCEDMFMNDGEKDVFESRFGWVIVPVGPRGLLAMVSGAFVRADLLLDKRGVGLEGRREGP